MYRLSLPFLLILVACGIPEELQVQTQRDLDKCRLDLGSLRSDNSRLTGQLDDSRRVTDSERAQTPNTMKAEDLAELRRQRDLASDQAAEWRALVQRLGALEKTGVLRAVERSGEQIISIPERSLFQPGTADLKAEARVTLGPVATALRDVPGRKVLVAGHTAPVPPAGKFRSNWELSTARAIAVVQVLQSEGLDPRRLSAVGQSEFRPQSDSHGGRVDLVLVPRNVDLGL